MARVVDAIYENGVIRPLARLDLPESQPLRITIEEVGPPAERPSDREQALAILRDVGVSQWTPEECERIFGRLPLADPRRSDEAFQKLGGKLSEELIQDRGDY